MTIKRLTTLKLLIEEPLDEWLLKFVINDRVSKIPKYEGINCPSDIVYDDFQNSPLMAFAEIIEEIKHCCIVYDNRGQ